MLIRFKQAGYKPKRTIKLALTYGEETTWAFNGAKWLAENRRDLIDAEFALNEGSGGLLDGTGKPVRMHVRGPSFYNLQAMSPMMENRLVADAVAIISTVDPIMGEVDR
jgi:acetylornithine deacetylase/succinyl-diaminopimelate desuccinylase-like protein